MTTASEEKQDARQKTWRRTPKGLGRHVSWVIDQLQAGVIASNPRSESVAALAQLRRGIGREPGFDYRLERYLAVSEKLLSELKELPESSDIIAADKIFDAEYAKHSAVTLYALHQQSRQEPMHVEGRGLGTAIAELARESDNPEGIRRRFAALGTAISYTEALYHLRGLIQLLRDKRISLDYGLLADDLRQMRKPGGTATVQTQWGREYFRRLPPLKEDPTAQPTDSVDETPETTDEETEQ